MRAALLAAVVIAAVPLTARAQTAIGAAEPSADAGQPPPTTQGPMIVERVHNGFLVAPEVKATEFDKRAEPLVGGSAGWVAAETLFIGGGGFWMPQKRQSDRELAYGGVVLQWFVVDGDRFGLSAKALFGGGEATLPETVTQYVYPPLPVPLPTAGRNSPPAPLPAPRLVTTTVRVRSDIAVAEPEINARLAFSKHVRLALGAGYRFAGSDWWRRNGFDRDAGNRLSGPTATIGLQIGG
jgi:hypothetical protein